MAYLMERLDDFPDWVTITAFYKAVHLVEAAFTCNPNVLHTCDHGGRLRVLKTDRCYSHIYKHYRPLMTASMVARYLSESRAHQTQYGSFTDYLTPEQVRTEIVQHRLRQVESSTKKIYASGA